MEILDPASIEQQINEKTVEYIKMVMKTIEMHMRQLLVTKGTDVNVNLECSAQVIALLAASRYVALTVPEEIHLQLLQRADNMAKDLINQFHLVQRKMKDEAPPTETPYMTTKTTAKA